MNYQENRLVKGLIQISLIASFAVVVSLLFLSVNQAQSASNSVIPGDMFIADPSAPTEQGGIYHLDSLGNQKAVYSGANFEEPIGIAIDGDGNLIVGDPQAFSLGGAVFKINPATGAQTVVSQGQYFVDPRGVAVAANGDIFVADSDAFNYYGGVIKVNPVTGVQTPVYISTDQNAGPYYLTVAPNGDIIVGDVSGFGQLGGIIRINPTTGAWTVVSSGGNFVDPLGVVVAPNGDIFVADNIGKVIKVNPATGAQTVIASGGPFVCPTGIAFDNSGNLLVDDPCNEPGAVIKLNPATGAAAVLASFGSSPHGIAVVPSAATACVVPPSGVVSLWPGEGNADDAVGTNNGTLLGGATFMPGQVGQAFKFDGVDDFVSVTNAASLRLQDFTIDVWIKLEGPLPGWPASLAAFGQYGYAFAIDSGTFTGSAARSLILSKTGASQVNGPAVPNDGAWHHVAVTKTGSTVTFYIDGVGFATSYNVLFTFDGAAGGDFAIGTNPIYLSQGNSPATYAFPGLIDEMEVVNRALTTAEIQQHYQNGINCGTTPTDIIAPTIVIPAPIIVEAVSPAGAVVTYDASATDNVGVTSFFCSPASGSTFPVGQTTVNCSASDAAGNTANASFTVTVSYNPPPPDLQPPTITAPPDVTVPASSPAGASDVALGTPVVSDNIDPNPTVTNNAPAVFPIGTTMVIWTAQDQAGNSAQATQQVTVLPLPPGYTDTGTNVLVTPIPGVSLNFSDVSVGGVTTVTTSSSGPVLPPLFKLGTPPTYYDINTTAVYSPPVEVCFSYAGTNYQKEDNLRLKHFDGINWEDITKLGYPDTVNKIICGITSALSPFAVMEPEGAAPALEAVIKFDPVSKRIKVYDSNTGNEVSYVMLLPKKHKDDNGEGGWESRKYTLSNPFHSLVIVLEYKNEGKESKVRVVSTQYDDGAVVNAVKNKMQAEYSQEKSGSLKELEQKIEVQKLFNVEAKYNVKKDKTEIKLKLDKQKEQKETRTGIVILELLTEQGGLKYHY